MSCSRRASRLRPPARCQTRERVASPEHRQTLLVASIATAQRARRSRRRRSLGRTTLPFPPRLRSRCATHRDARTSRPRRASTTYSDQKLGGNRYPTADQRGLGGIGLELAGRSRAARESRSPRPRCTRAAGASADRSRSCDCCARERFQLLLEVVKPCATCGGDAARSRATGVSSGPQLRHRRT